MKKILALVLVAALCFSLAACTGTSSSSSKTDSSSQATASITGKKDLAGKKIGVQLGTTGDIYASDYEKEGSKIERYNKGADAIMALTQGKIDCVIIDNEPAKVFVANNSSLKILEEPFEVEDYAICLAKSNTELKDKINAALKTLKDNGTLKKIIDNYIGENAGKTPYTSPADVKRTNGTLTMATNAEFPPYEYVESEKVVGIDADMAQAVCDVLGYELKIDNMEFDSIISAVSSGKADIGVAGMTVTDERLKAVNFTDPYTTATQVIIVKK